MDPYELHCYYSILMSRAEAYYESFTAEEENDSLALYTLTVGLGGVFLRDQTLWCVLTAARAQGYLTPEEVYGITCWDEEQPILWSEPRG